MRFPGTTELPLIISGSGGGGSSFSNGCLVSICTPPSPKSHFVGSRFHYVESPAERAAGTLSHMDDALLKGPQYRVSNDGRVEQTKSGSASVEEEMCFAC